jgi:type VI secretion system protein ImpA
MQRSYSEKFQEEQARKSANNESLVGARCVGGADPASPRVALLLSVRHDMALIDIPTLLQPVSPALPCGPNLEYSPLYLEALRAVEGRPDAQYGSLHVAAVEPDWKRVKTVTLELLAQSRDLRLALWLTRSLVGLHGVAGVADGCALIEGWLARYWDHVYPQLDEEEDGDPTARLNTLSALNDTTGLVRELGSALLVDSPRHGRVYLRDIEPAEVGEVRSSDVTLDPAAVDARFADADVDAVVALDDALVSAQRSLQRIDALITDRLGPGGGIALTALQRILERAGQVVHAQRERHPAFVGASPERGAADVMPAPFRDERIASRADVVRMLDRLCAYYAQAEPSSAVPLLLQRARKLVGMRFIEAVAELAPAGAEQARHWAGANLE